MTLLEEASAGLGRLPLASGMEAELYVCRGEERGVECKGGAVSVVQESLETGAGLRLCLADGRMGFASAAGPLGESLSGLFERASAQLGAAQPDPHRRLPEPLPLGPLEGLEDGSLFAGPLSSWGERLLAAQEMALRADRRLEKVLQASYGESREETAVASTRGVRAGQRASLCSAGFSLLASEGGETQVGSSYRASRRAAGLDLEALAGEAAWRAAAQLGGRKLPSRKRSVLFDPWAAGEMLDLLSDALCADVVQRGKSLFEGKRRERIASACVTFMDDPLLPGGAASSAFDDEGLPCSRLTPVENGVLHEYFYDSYSAAKEGRASNGCAARAGYKSLPGPSCSNFYLKPGALTREKLIADTQDGILVLELMGMHTADPVSGEFSVGVSGLAVENGRLAGALRGAMLSGNILDVLERVDAVADDLTFYGALAAPTFRVRDLTVA